MIDFHIRTAQPNIIVCDEGNAPTPYTPPPEAKRRGVGGGAMSVAKEKQNGW